MGAGETTGRSHQQALAGLLAVPLCAVIIRRASTRTFQLLILMVGIIFALPS